MSNFAVISAPNFFEGHTPVQASVVIALCDTRDEACDIVASQPVDYRLSHGQYAPTSYRIASVEAIAFDGDFEAPALDWLEQGASEDEANGYDKVSEALWRGSIDGWLPVASMDIDGNDGRIVAVRVSK
jgi:hypothetical protein